MGTLKPNSKGTGMTLFESFVFAAQFLKVPLAGLIVALVGVAARIFAKHVDSRNDEHDFFNCGFLCRYYSRCGDDRWRIDTQF